MVMPCAPARSQSRRGDDEIRLAIVRVEHRRIARLPQRGDVVDVDAEFHRAWLRHEPLSTRGFSV